MDAIDPFVVLTKTSKRPARNSEPWTWHDFVDHDLLRGVLGGFEAIGRHHSRFYLVADEMRRPLYEDLAQEPVEWCGEPMALGIRFVQWRLMERVCAFFNLGLPGAARPPSGRRPPDLAYTTRFIELAARRTGAEPRAGDEDPSEAGGGGRQEAGGRQVQGKENNGRRRHGR
ncbi:hypothetical protein ISF_04236 [Cordyceps fumosorosea ARSEF 2679]|uniref:Uncharacterized protein n=1 Tax=Cordyceps fumosorosea (strain ARSEF 2679) TaxID=1081104 RepID=A0A167XD18_CORFA|nr:hypothetical protein ISF_04236 [Cordyceps fumosorosea ARSEF 2679]OAA64826.1 hypothetical protein ISF_04236 [Cordyceps fumosorosea ARSEF 2679]